LRSFDAFKQGEPASSPMYAVPGANVGVLPDGADAILRPHGYTVVSAGPGPPLKAGSLRLDQADGTRTVLEPGQAARRYVDWIGQWGVYIPKGTPMPMFIDGKDAHGRYFYVAAADAR